MKIERDNISEGSDHNCRAHPGPFFFYSAIYKIEREMKIERDNIFSNKKERENIFSAYLS